METLFKTYFTQIRIVLPMGIEFFYIANFDKGLRLSKWYRGQSPIVFQARRLARMNVFGVDD